MGKRTLERGSNDPTKKPKFNYSKAQNHLEPNTKGVYISCDRGKESRAKLEIIDLLEEKYEELLEKKIFKPINEDVEEDKELDFEEQMKKELLDLKKAKTDKKINPFVFIDLQMECLLFIKFHRCIDPVVLVLEILKDAFENDIKRTRYCSKIIPITDSCSASEENLNKLIENVYKKQNLPAEPTVFSVDITRRLFQVLERDHIMKISTAKLRELNPNITINYKSYDKLLIVQCFKSNIGISIVSEQQWKDYKKFNLNQIFETKKK